MVLLNQNVSLCSYQSDCFPLDVTGDHWCVSPWQTVTGCGTNQGLQIPCSSAQLCLRMRSLGRIWVPFLPFQLCPEHPSPGAVWLGPGWWGLCSGSSGFMLRVWLTEWPARNCWPALHPDNLRYPVSESLLWFKIKTYYQLSLPLKSLMCFVPEMLAVFFLSLALE